MPIIIEMNPFNPMNSSISFLKSYYLLALSVSCNFFFFGAFVSGRGIYILYEDVKKCQYEDVHILWSILVESNSPPLPSKQ